VCRIRRDFADAVRQAGDHFAGPLPHSPKIFAHPGDVNPRLVLQPGIDDGDAERAAASDTPRLARQVRQRFCAGVTRLTESLAEKLAQMGNPQPQEAASSMLAELVGAVSLARAEPDPARSDAILEISRRAVKLRLGLKESA